VTLYLKTLLSSAGYNPITITGEDTSFQKQQKENDFRDGVSRVCIMSILAGGEGRNMQFCDTAMLAEQYWVPAKIEQFKGRFHRIGSTSEHVSMTAYYLKDSIDEYFQELLDLKKRIVGTAMSTDWEVNLDPDAIMSLASKLVQTRRKFAA
jgi:SNF2 family DNA or RNA helicase